MVQIEEVSVAGATMDTQAVASRQSVARGDDTVDEPREGGQESVIVEKKGDWAAVCKWTLTQFTKVKARALWSKYFEVGGYDCRLLVYPKGDSQALPGYLSIYLQVTDPRANSSSKWDCFASYRLCVVNHRDDTKSVQRDSWHRFSGKKKSHGWCDFTPSSAILDPRAGFLVNDSVLITAEILVLNECVSFSRDAENAASSSTMPGSGDVLSGKFTWKVQNLSLFKEMIKTQKIMSPVFPAGECNLRLSVYQSSVSGVEYLSMCLESKDTEKSQQPERSCWCLFRMSVLNHRAGMNHMHRDSYGRFAADNKTGDNTSLGWNDYMKMVDFSNPETGYLVEDTAIFSASFHVIKESSNFHKNLPGGGVARRIPSRSERSSGMGEPKSDGFQGKFVWKIENFTKLKDLLKKRKITGLCIKSRRFQVGNRDCRLIVYPRGQSQPPCHLSMFLEVTDPRSTAADWSCFVSHRLSVVNQRFEDRSVAKESQNRYSKAAKDWGWREFVTLTSLFDQDSGFLVNDTVVFSAEVLILKESTSLEIPEPDASAVTEGKRVRNCGIFTWRVENFVAFKEIMETRKIFSKYFQAGGCELRIGVYESFDTLCIYLESEPSMGQDPETNFWVRYKIAVVNQRYPDRTSWKESSICTKTWNNSVLQFMKVSDLLELDSGYLVRETVVFACDILDCCPWFEFSDLDVMAASEDDQDGLSTDPDELVDSEDSDGASVDEEDTFRSLLARAGLHLSYGDNPPMLSDPSALQALLREKLLMDAGAVATFLAGLRMYLDDPLKLKRLLLPTRLNPVYNAPHHPSIPNRFVPGHSNPRGAPPPAGPAAGPPGAGVPPSTGMGPIPNMGVFGPGGFKGPVVGVPVDGAFGVGEERTSPSLMNLLMGVKVLQQAIVDLLLDIMVECCMARKRAEGEGCGSDASAAERLGSMAGTSPLFGSAGGGVGNVGGQGVGGGAASAGGHGAGPSSSGGMGASAPPPVFGSGFGSTFGSFAPGVGGPERCGGGSARGNGGATVATGAGPSVEFPRPPGYERSADRVVGSSAERPSGAEAPRKGPPSGAVEQRLEGSGIMGGQQCVRSDCSAGESSSMGASVRFGGGSVGPALGSAVPAAVPSGAQGLGSVAGGGGPVSFGAPHGFGEFSSGTGDPAAAGPGFGGQAALFAGGRGTGTGQKKFGSAEAAGVSAPSGGFSDVADTPPEGLAREASGNLPKPKWPDQAEELLGLIVNSLGALDTMIPAAMPEPCCRPQSAQRVALVLEHAPKNLQLDLVALVPKLVDPAEHAQAAEVLLERLQQSGAEPPLRLPVLGALSQLEVGQEVSQAILCEALDALQDAVDGDQLAALVSYALKAGTECGELPQAVRVVRTRLKQLGPSLPPRILDVIRTAALQRLDVAEALLQDIDADMDRSNCEELLAAAHGSHAGAAPPFALFGASPSWLDPHVSLFGGLDSNFAAMYGDRGMGEFASVDRSAGGYVGSPTGHVGLEQASDRGENASSERGQGGAFEPGICMFAAEGRPSSGESSVVLDEEEGSGEEDEEEGSPSQLVGGGDDVAEGEGEGLGGASCLVEEGLQLEHQLPSSEGHGHAEASHVLEHAQAAAAPFCWRLADVDILVELLAVPSMRPRAHEAFERAISRGAFAEQSVVMVLERRHSQRLLFGSPPTCGPSINSPLAHGYHHPDYSADSSFLRGFAGVFTGMPPSSTMDPRAYAGPMGMDVPGPGPGSRPGTMAPPVPGQGPPGAGPGLGLGDLPEAGVPVSPEESADLDSDFPAVLGLAEYLLQSHDARVREFVTTLYAVMFKVYGDEGYRERVLRSLVERACSSNSAPEDAALGMDILTFLVREEDGTAQPVLAMMREASEVARSGRDVIWQQLQALEEELARSRTGAQAEAARLQQEKVALTAKLHDTEVALQKLKAEMKVEADKATRERRDLLERVRDMEGQLEWAKAEREEEEARLAQEMKTLQERLRDSDAQLAKLRTQKRDELKKVVKEKNELAMRLKNAEAARKRFDEELKRYATENVSREEVRQSLEDEIRHLKSTVGATTTGLREKEEQVMRCEMYIDGMEAKLHAHQDYIQTLETSLQEEMARHAPLYGAGLEALSLPELETLARIHDEGLRQVRVLIQQHKAEKDGSLPEPSSSAPVHNGPRSGLASSASLYQAQFNNNHLPTSGVALMPSLANGVGLGAQVNGHINGSNVTWTYPPA